MGNLFSLSGRAKRSEYLVVALCAIIPALIASMMMESDSAPLAFIGGVLFIVIWWICFATQIRRIHDRNHSGWFVLLAIVPLVNIIFGIYLFFWPSVDYGNRFNKVDRQSQPA